MCGRVVASSAREYFGSAFDVTETVGDELAPSYNVAPQAFVYAIVDTETSRRLGVMQWGLVPSWAADPDNGPRRRSSWKADAGGTPFTLAHQ